MLITNFTRDAEDHLRRALFRWSSRNFERCAVPIAALPDKISSEIAIRGYFELHVLAQLAVLLRLNPQYLHDRIALDIGANIGNHAIFLSNMFASTYAFEPNPITFHILSANILLTGNAIRGVPLALSNQTHAVEIAFSGADLGGASLTSRPGATRRAVVQAKTLDDWLNEQALSPASIGFIKIDVEDHEDAVLQGARRFLSTCDALIGFETSSTTDPTLLLNLLTDGGYSHFYEIQKRANAGANVFARSINTLRFGAERHTVESRVQGHKFREMALASKGALRLA